MKLSFDGRNLAVLLLAAVCVYGIFSGTSLALAAKELQIETKSMKEKIERLRSGDNDQLSMPEMLEVAALKMQMELDPSFLEKVDSEAGSNLMRGYAMLAGSLIGAGALFVYHRNNRPTRQANIDA